MGDSPSHKAIDKPRVKRLRGSQKRLASGGLHIEPMHMQPVEMGLYVSNASAHAPTTCGSDEKEALPLAACVVANCP
jgi:hypothetical protein